MESYNIPVIKSVNMVMDCPDAGKLAEFYSKLLGWNYSHPYTNGWAAITSTGGQVIAFQEIDGYEPPVWPWEKGKQGQMLHLDMVVENLEKGIQHALECGAVMAETQYFDDSRTLFDPAGHPFCIDVYTVNHENSL